MEKEEQKSEIIARLKQIAKVKFGSLKNLEIAIGKNVGFLSTYFSRGIIPSYEVMQILADKHNININWLLTGRGNMLVDSKDNVEIVDSTMQPVPYLTLEAISKMQEDLILIKEKIGVYEK